jgi:hypothetical protein
MAWHSVVRWWARLAGRALAVTKIEGWKASLEHITEEITGLWLDRLIWRSIREMVEELPRVRDSFIVAWIGQQYYRRAALSVRTMVDRDSKSDSLLSLLIDISSNPTDVTCPGALHAMRAPGLNTVDPALVQVDIDALTASAENVRQYVNKYLAHIAKSPKVQIPAITEVDDGVQLLGELLEKYTLLLRDVDLQVEPLLVFDWVAGLREPWLSPESERRRAERDFSKYTA